MSALDLHDIIKKKKKKKKKCPTALKVPFKKFGDFVTVARKVWRNREKFKILLFLLFISSKFVLENHILFAQEAEMLVHKKLY